jgi:hypothetical protein
MGREDMPILLRDGTGLAMRVGESGQQRQMAVSEEGPKVIEFPAVPGP